LLVEVIGVATGVKVAVVEETRMLHLFCRGKNERLEACEETMRVTTTYLVRVTME